jgi:hypothetical protein
VEGSHWVVYTSIVTRRSWLTNADKALGEKTLELLISSANIHLVTELRLEQGLHSTEDETAGSVSHQQLDRRGPGTDRLSQVPFFDGDDRLLCMVWCVDGSKTSE